MRDHFAGGVRQPFNIVEAGAMQNVVQARPRRVEALRELPLCAIDNPRAEPAGALGYWPQLSNLSPRQIGNYLKWLAEGLQN